MSSSATSPMARFRVQLARTSTCAPSSGSRRSAPTARTAPRCSPTTMSRALEFARAAGQDVSRIAERARVALWEAGDRAYGLSAWGAAVGFYRDALELWPPDDPESRAPALPLRARWSRCTTRTGAGVPVLEEARDAFSCLGGARGGRRGRGRRSCDAYWFTGSPDLAREHLQSSGLADRRRDRRRARRRSSSARWHGSRCSATTTSGRSGGAGDARDGGGVRARPRSARRR